MDRERLFRLFRRENPQDFESPVSGNSARELMKFYDIPANFDKLRFLDIGGGESDLTARLLSQGADAYAIDPLYGNLDELHKRRLRNLLSLQNIPYPNDPNFDPFEQWDPDIDTHRFLVSFKRNPDRYIAGTALELPFESNSMDYVVSYLAVFGHLDLNIDPLREALEESVRVLKPGGKLQFGPLGAGLGLSSPEIKNQVKLVKDLKKDKRLLVTPTLSSMQGIDTGRLNILKIS